jgi:hypothetical protein
MNPASKVPASVTKANETDQLRYARFGLAIPSPLLKALAKRGVYCQPAVSMEHQHLARQYVIRATESGGAVSDMGRYNAYVDLDGKPLPWLQPLDSLSGNGRHAIVISAELVRIEMLRVGRTYELAISKHSLTTVSGRVRPVLASNLLFHGRQGTLTLDLWKKENASLRGSVSPIFYSPSGEARNVPEKFDQVIRKITGAVACLGCKHTHIAVPLPRAAP